MTPGFVRRLAGAFAVIAASAMLAAETPATSPPLVYSAEVDSIIHPVSAEYMMETMERADRADAALVVFTLRTPGGLVDSTRDIVTRMLASKTPVAVFVGPSGARAASAGFLITIAADVAAMAPGTHIGAAHPVGGGGRSTNDTAAKKAAADVAAYARTIAGTRLRNSALAEEAVNNSRAFTEDEALNASPPLIDLVASDVPELLRKLDGRAVTRFNGRDQVLKTAGAQVIPVEMTLRQRLLSTIAHPEIAYILLSLGTLGLTVELWSPGALVPGIAGGLCLLLAFFALQILPINYAGLGLMLFGLLLLVLEVKVTSYGLLMIGGAASLLFGSMILMDSSVPGLQLSLSFVLPIVLGIAGITVFLVRLAVRSQRTRVVTGVAGMMGEVGYALTAFEPGTSGLVSTHGEIWRAVAGEPILEGDRLRIVSVDGLTVTVQKDSPTIVG